MSKDKMKLGDNFAVIDERVYVAIRREELEEINNLVDALDKCFEDAHALTSYYDNNKTMYIVSMDRNGYIDRGLHMSHLKALVKAYLR